MSRAGLRPSDALTLYEKFVLNGRETVPSATVSISATAAASSSSSTADVIADSSGFDPPPIPSEIRSSLAADPMTFRRHPRWYPTRQILWNLEQNCQASAQLDENDANSVYAHCERLSGLKSGQVRVGPAGSDVKVLYWSKQECGCSASSSSPIKLFHKNVCQNGPKCRPFVAIIQVYAVIFDFFRAPGVCYDM